MERKREGKRNESEGDGLTGAARHGGGATRPAA